MKYNHGLSWNLRSCSTRFLFKACVSSQFMKSSGSVRRKTFAGMRAISVLSQMIPARVRLRRFLLPCLVKLPTWSLCVKKNRSPLKLLLNCSAETNKEIISKWSLKFYFNKNSATHSLVSITLWKMIHKTKEYFKKML